MAERRILTGGCACGQLTFEDHGRAEARRPVPLHDLPQDQRRAFNAFVIYPVDQVTITGETRAGPRRRTAERCFCPVCGSQVFYRDGGDEIEIKLGAFDEPEPLHAHL